MNRRLFAFVFIAAAIMFVSSFSGTTFAATTQAISNTSTAAIWQTSDFPIFNQTLNSFNNSRGIAGYEQINGGSWFSINVTETSGPPNATTPKEGGNYGIEGGNLPVSTGIWESVVEVSFSEFSGEADGTWYLGDNSWSIQLNTNDFYGNNGHWDAVQFVFKINS